MTTDTRAFRGGLLFLLAWVGVLAAGILVVNRGTFIYTLDDGYIHMALAENILRGHYGVNLGEFSAPSSSILWAFLLAPFQGMGDFIGSLSPLFLNVASAIAALGVFHAVLKRTLRDALPGRAMTLALVISVIAANLAALAFTGMEHTLQVLVASLAALGIGIETREGRLPRWLPWVLVAGPLVRYENILISLPLILYLVLRRHYLPAFLSAAGLLALLGGFSAWLLHLDLYALPTSVVAKTTLHNVGVPDLSMLPRLHHALRADQGSYILVCLLLLLGRVFYPGNHRNRLLAAAAAVALSLHLFLSFGQITTFNRYDTYMWVFSLLTLLWLYGEPLAALLRKGTGDRRSRLLTAALAILLTVVVCDRFLVSTLVLPASSNDIYRQQYQMQRFVREVYRKPVGINDLGLVSWRNDAYVLDLFGLASIEALERRGLSPTPEWMDTLARAHDVRLIMIYDSWFRDGVPESWIRVGKLQRRAHSHAGGRGVDFYATDTQALAEVTSALREFRKTLPPNAPFTFTASAD